MGWTSFYQYPTSTTTRKEFADFCLADFVQSVNTQDILMYQILDHSLNKDGLTMLACYTQEHIDFINAKYPQNEPRTTDDKFIIHLLLSSDDGEWGYKELTCSSGIFIENCPKRIIDKYKDNNPRYERLLKLYEQGKNGESDCNFTINTIKRWEKAQAEKKEQASKNKNLREILKQAFEKGDVLFEVKDGLEVGGIKVTEQYDVLFVPPKKQSFVAQCYQFKVDVKYEWVTALIEKSTGNVIWGEARPPVKVSLD